MRKKIREGEIYYEQNAKDGGGLLFLGGLLLLLFGLVLDRWDISQLALGLTLETVLRLLLLKADAEGTQQKKKGLNVSDPYQYQHDLKDVKKFAMMAMRSLPYLLLLHSPSLLLLGFHKILSRLQLQVDL